MSVFFLDCTKSVHRKSTKITFLLLLAYYFCFTTEIFHGDLLKCMKSCPTLFGSILGIDIPLLRSFKLGGLIKLFTFFVF